MWTSNKRGPVDEDTGVRAVLGTRSWEDHPHSDDEVLLRAELLKLKGQMRPRSTHIFHNLIEEGPYDEDTKLRMHHMAETYNLDCINDLQCQYCPRTFTNGGSLNIHTWFKHGKTCVKCKTFLPAPHGNYIDHVCPRAPVTICPECNRYFPAGLSTHIKMAHLRVVV